MTNQPNKPSTIFWIISVIALIWNALGVMAYLNQAFMTAEDFAALSEAEQALYADYPAWATAAFAIAVFGGALGSIFLLIRKKLAYITFIVSFLGIVVQMIQNLVLSNAIEVYGPGGMIMPIMVLLIGLGLIFYSKKAIGNGWIN